MRTVVGVLRGGPSSEYEVSLKSGAAVLGALDKDKYDARDLFVDRAGTWHYRGVPLDPSRALAGVDVVFTTMHGSLGDGSLHSILDPLGVPYTGSERLAWALANSRHTARATLHNAGLRVPFGSVVELRDPEQQAGELFRTTPQPSLLTPVGSRQSFVANNYHSLVDALAQAGQYATKVVLEEHIAGPRVSVGVIDQYRNTPTYALIPHPADTLTRAQKDTLVDMAARAHQALGLRHYSQSDFVLSRRGIYLLDVHTQPALHDESIFVQALRSVGASLSHFVGHVVDLVKRA